MSLWVSLCPLQAQSVSLEWDPSPEPDVAGYHVYRSTEGGSFRRLTASAVQIPEFVDSSASFDTPYHYAVTAVTATGLESGFSNLVPIYLGPSFAHFTSGGGVATRLVLQNPRDEPVSGTVSFLDPLGEPLLLEINGELVAGALDFSVPGLGVRSYATTADGPLLVASAVIESERRLGAVFLLSGLLGRTATGATTPTATAVVPVEWSVVQDLQTGVALANPTESAATVSISLFDSEGALVAQSEQLLSLPPGGQSSRFPFEMLNLDLLQWPRFTGSLEIRSDRPLALLGLRLDPGGLVTVPVTPRP